MDVLGDSGITKEFLYLICLVETWVDQLWILGMVLGSKVHFFP